jgi:hypothetical protein
MNIKSYSGYDTSRAKFEYKKSEKKTVTTVTKQNTRRNKKATTKI